MHSEEIAQSTAKRNVIYVVTAGSDFIKTAFERTAFACTNLFFTENINRFQLAQVKLKTSWGCDFKPRIRKVACTLIRFQQKLTNG